MLTGSKINNLAEAVRLGSPFAIKPTKKQSGRFPGTLLPGLGVLPLLTALTGDGIQSHML